MKFTIEVLRTEAVSFTVEANTLEEALEDIYGGEAYYGNTDDHIQRVLDANGNVVWVEEKED